MIERITNGLVKDRTLGDLILKKEIVVQASATRMLVRVKAHHL